MIYIKIKEMFLNTYLKIINPEIARKMVSLKRVLGCTKLVFEKCGLKLIDYKKNLVKTIIFINFSSLHNANNSLTILECCAL